ncbi:MAG: cadmium-translocating P-type ATPase [Ideonella sp.]|nr:cadmium-translocating P-type ATPase [Ideonella sp.]
MTSPPSELAAPKSGDVGTTGDLAVLDDPVEQRRFTRFSVGPGGTAIAESSLRISGMHCAACAGIIEHALSQVDGVIESSVSSAGERARVRWNPARTKAAQLVAAIRRAGYDAMPDAALEAREARKQEHRTALWRLFVAAFCAMQVMMMATPSYVTHGDELAPDLRQLLNWGSWLLTLPVLVFSSGPFFRGAWLSLRKGSIGMDVPVALGIAVTFVASSGATFNPQGIFGQEVYFDSLTMFVSFLLAGRWLEVRARHRVAQVLETALDGMPETAHRVRPDGTTELVSVQRLQAGDLVRVALGQAFPADGHLVDGETSADEALLTGESRPVPKAIGEAVVGGSMNMGAPVVVRLDRVGDDTRLQAIVAMMRDAMSQRPEAARAADRWAGPFLWIVLLLAAGAAAVWSVIDPSKAVWVGVSVLIVTCPCALSLAVPAALLAASSTLARRGVLLQRLDALEAWTRVQRVYLDKTGTLTDDKLHWIGMTRLAVSPSGPMDAELLRMAVALAAWSTHPISQALVASHESAQSALAWRQVKEVPGSGLEAVDEQGRTWRLGSASFVGAIDNTKLGASVWFGQVAADCMRFEFEENLRDDAVQAVAGLRERGMEVILLSGDRTERAEAVARRLPVSRVIGGATPESKLSEIESAQAQGLRVAMVGDGINDAPVLARADVSFAMGQGALVARAQSDAIVVSSRLSDLNAMHDLASRTMTVVRQNLAWAAFYNLTCIPLALIGWLPPWAAGLGMASSSVLVILNAMRLAR